MEELVSDERGAVAAVTERLEEIARSAGAGSNESYGLLPDWGDAANRLKELVDEIHEGITQYAREESCEAGGKAMVTVVDWKGGFSSVSVRGVTAECVARHWQLLAERIGFRSQVLRALLAGMRAAMAISAALAVPASAPGAVAAVWRLVSELNGLAKLCRERQWQSIQHAVN